MTVVSKIVCFIYGRDVPSFQSKLSIDRSTSVRKVDGLNLILIDIYIPVITPHLH